jgi:CRP/FNR family cyclic AMP-dependent transcriptional regulator
VTNAKALTHPAVKEFISRAHKRSVPPKHTIVRAGEQPDSLYLILEGSVSVMLEDNEGREIVLAYLNGGDFFGEMCLFPEHATRTAIVNSRVATLVAQLNYDAFRSFVSQHPEIMFVIAEQLSVRLRDTSRRMADLAFLDVQGRTARALLEMAEAPEAKPGIKGTLVKVSRQELARIVGCSREMAGRVLKRLEENGILSMQGRNLLLHGVGKTPAKT